VYTAVSIWILNLVYGPRAPEHAESGRLRGSRFEQSMAMDVYLLIFRADSLGAQRTRILIINLVRMYLCVIQCLHTKFSIIAVTVLLGP
jgi:hypothetical protein